MENLLTKKNIRAVESIATHFGNAFNEIKMLCRNLLNENEVDLEKPTHASQFIDDPHVFIKDYCSPENIQKNNLRIVDEYNKQHVLIQLYRFMFRDEFRGDRFKNVWYYAHSSLDKKNKKAWKKLSAERFNELNKTLRYAANRLALCFRHEKMPDGYNEARWKAGIAFETLQDQLIPSSFFNKTLRNMLESNHAHFGPMR